MKLDCQLCSLYWILYGLYIRPAQLQAEVSFWENNSSAYSDFFSLLVHHKIISTHSLPTWTYINLEDRIWYTQWQLKSISCTFPSSLNKTARTASLVNRYCLNGLCLFSPCIFVTPFCLIYMITRQLTSEVWQLSHKCAGLRQTVATFTKLQTWEQKKLRAPA